MLSVVERLQELLQLDTTNPPGDETARIEFVRAQLAPSSAGCCTTSTGGGGR